MTRRVRTMAVLCSAVLLLSGCTIGGTPAAQDPVASGSPDPINHLKTEYTSALGKAKAWQQNATLIRVYRKYSGTITPKQPPPLVYAFSSLAEPTHDYEVSVTEKETKEAKVPRQPFEIGLNPIDTAQWNVGPDAALAKAEEVGGKPFREQHLAGYTVLVQLTQRGTFPLQWYVRYDTGDSSNKRYEVYLNATTGVVESQKEISL
jgi:hypothetical protein